MALNIVAFRKVSLKGFADGWDKCFLTVRAVSEKTRKSWMDELNKKSEEINSSDASENDKTQQLEKLGEEFLETQCLSVIEGGVIMNTDENGLESEYELQKGDIPALMEHLSFLWQRDIVSTATGANRLKANQ